MSNLVELKPCPFCGSEAVNPWKDVNKEDFKFTGLAHEIKCSVCPAKMLGNRSFSRLLKQWNRRTP